jgi:uncharacterized protein YbdZ (MbtH family)
MIDRIEDDDLRTDIRRVLARLETLSESRASNPERSARSSETPLGPPEFANLSEKDCPPSDRSLFDHFRWRFHKAIASGASTKRLYFLLWEAEKAYETRVVPPDPDNPRMALILTRADENALKRKVCEDYEGQHSYRVHLDLDLPQGWVERVREEAGREPETGYLRPKWRELPEEKKRELVQLLRADGKTQEEAARWLGVSRRTVVTYQAEAA